MNPDDGTPGCRDCGRETLLAAVLEGDGVDYVQLDAADVERATLKDPGEPLYAITGRRHADPLAAITSSARGRRAHRASCRSLAWLRAFTARRAERAEGVAGEVVRGEELPVAAEAPEEVACEAGGDEA